MDNDKLEKHPILMAVGELNNIRQAADGSVSVPKDLAQKLREAAMMGFLHVSSLRSFSRLKIDLDLQVGVHVNIDIPHVLSPDQVGFLRDNLEHLFSVVMSNHDGVERRRLVAANAGHTIAATEG